MAFSFKAKNANGATVYNVDYTVGRPGTNWKPDVLLVQALLNLLFFENGGTFFLNSTPGTAYGIDPPDNAAPLKLDGIKGPLTQQLIDTYQQGLQRIGPYPADGRLDPMAWSGDPQSPPTRGRGIALLGTSARLSDLYNGTHYYEALLTDTQTYGELCGYLKQTKSTARQYTQAAAPAAKKPIFNP